MRALRRSVVILLALAAACATRTADVEEPVSTDAPTTVRVENRSWSEMTVYVLRGTERIRLGTVSATATRVFPIPDYVMFGMTTLRFLADPLGSTRTPISQEIVVSPGDEVQLVIPNT